MKVLLLLPKSSNNEFVLKKKILHYLMGSVIYEYFPACSGPVSKLVNYNTMHSDTVGKLVA